jgi:hypothetical protein
VRADQLVLAVVSGSFGTFTLEAGEEQGQAYDEGCAGYGAEHVKVSRSADPQIFTEHMQIPCGEPILDC